MKTTIPAHDDPVLLMDTAMQWLLRLRDESVTEVDIAHWLSWYEEDAAHRRAFDDAQHFWNSAGALAEGPDGMQRLKRLHAGGQAASAPPVMAMPSASRGWRPSRLRGWWSRHGRVAGLGTAAALMVAAVIAWQGRFDDGVLQAPQDAALAPDVRTMTLPDGSQVDLAARSSVELQYTRESRLLKLQAGEAYFSVQPDRQRPFVVDVGDLHVLAVGTAFNIRHSDNRVIVTVSHGIVDVYPPDAAGTNAASTESASRRIRVRAGSQVDWARGAAHPLVTSVDPARALAWRQGRLEFIDQPLSEVVIEVNRYAPRPVEIADEQAAALAYTGTVLTRATDEWLMALPANFPVRLINDNGRIVIAHSPSARDREHQ